MFSELFRCNKCGYQQEGTDGLMCKIQSLSQHKHVCVDCGWVYIATNTCEKEKLCQSCKSRYNEYAIYEWIKDFCDWLPVDVINLVHDYSEMSESEIPVRKIPWHEQSWRRFPES